MHIELLTYEDIRSHNIQRFYIRPRGNKLWGAYLSEVCIQRSFDKDALEEFIERMNTLLERSDFLAMNN